MFRRYFTSPSAVEARRLACHVPAIVRMCEERKKEWKKAGRKEGEKTECQLEGACWSYLTRPLWVFEDTIVDFFLLCFHILHLINFFPRRQRKLSSAWDFIFKSPVSPARPVSLQRSEFQTVTCAPRWPPVETDKSDINVSLAHSDERESLKVPHKGNFSLQPVSQALRKCTDCTRPPAVESSLWDHLNY